MLNPLSIVTFVGHGDIILLKAVAIYDFCYGMSHRVDESSYITTRGFNNLHPEKLYGRAVYIPLYSDVHLTVVKTVVVKPQEIEGQSY